MAEVVPDLVPSEIVTKVIEPRTEARVCSLADGLLDLLLKRVTEGTATSSDMKVAADYIKDSGIKLMITPGSKAGELVRKLPDLDGDDKVLTLPQGVSVRFA